ncbi:MAG TPA: helix-turn-helix domain-containing protein [Anaerolineae bacterium]|nr:helix-turn-helix domain-containing protein [Anaerolineae bacterium]
MSEYAAELRLRPNGDRVDGLLTAREAAAFLRVSLNTLWRMERRNLITPYRTPGGHRRYSADMLRTYLERTRVRSWEME